MWLNIVAAQLRWKVGSCQPWQSRLPFPSRCAFWISSITTRYLQPTNSSLLLGPKFTELLVACDHSQSLSYQLQMRNSPLHTEKDPRETSVRYGCLAVCRPKCPTQLLLMLYRWYKGLAPKTRMIMGVGIMAYAGFGLLMTDEIEQRFGMTPTEQDYEEVRKLVPKISTIEKGQRP